MTVTTAFPFSIPPLSNISPFTYRDGATYLEILYALRDYINLSLRPEFDTEMQSMFDQFQAGIANAEATITAQEGDWTTRFNAFMADVNTSLMALNDASMGTLVNDPASATSTALAALYAKATDLTALTDLTTTGRLSDTSLTAMVGALAVKRDETVVIVSGTAAADIQAAIDRARPGQTVFFPPGTYDLVARVRLRGGLQYSAYGAVFKKTDTSQGYAVFYTGSDGAKGYGSGDSNIVFRGGLFQGNFAASNAICGFALHHTDNFILQETRFSQCNMSAHSLDMMGCSNVLIENCVFEGFLTQGGGYTKEEVIQCDVSSSASGSAPDLGGSYDGLACKNVTVNRCRFLPLTVGGVTYPAPNALGSHANFESATTRNVKFTNNYILDGQLDSVSDVRGMVHFLGVDGLLFADNTIEYSYPQNTMALGLLSDNKGIPTTGANYEAGASNTVTTLPAPLTIRNVKVRDNRFIGFSNVNGAGGYGTIAVMQGFDADPAAPVYADNISITGNRFDMSNTGAGTPNSIYVHYATNVYIGGKNIFNGPTRPMDIDHVNDIEVSNNLSTGARADAFRFSFCTRVRISGIDAVASIGSGIYTTDCTRLTIQNNLIESNDVSRAVGVSNGTQFIVSGNNIKAPLGTRGIQVYIGTGGAAANGTIFGNIIGGGTATHVDIGTTGITNVSEVTGTNMKLAA